MEWKAVFLVFLVLSSLAVAVGVTTLNVLSTKTLRFEKQKESPPTQTPQQPIDDESGGG